MDDPTIAEVPCEISPSSSTVSCSEAFTATKSPQAEKKKFLIHKVVLYTTVALLISSMANLMVATMNGNTAGFWGALVVIAAYITILVAIKIQKASYFAFYIMVQSMAMLIYLFASFRLIWHSFEFGWSSFLTGMAVLLSIPLIIGYIYLLMQKTHHIHTKKRRIKQADMTLNQFDNIRSC
ncbi:unnamed protein product [Bursaphelenchus okinawaensis]|uniref:Uncharacterized protein n=1 Tax=Bursaphelenchus okinawaensis TaxID=465554 RepID=A0A811K5N2_9BILA|nr:unnamed protein product [Bursaphelenchus okinawaensis]CAG9091844.1 unnamed protein product [Bursaphelenchus okinawaensis]